MVPSRRRGGCGGWPCRRSGSRRRRGSSGATSDGRGRAARSSRGRRRRRSRRPLPATVWMRSPAAPCTTPACRRRAARAARASRAGGGRGCGEAGHRVGLSRVARQRHCRRVDARSVECATLPRMPRRPPARLLRALVVGLLAAGDRRRGWPLTRRRRASASSVDSSTRAIAVRGEHALPDVVVRRDRRGRRSPASTAWPFPRRLHAQAIRALLRAGARTVAYDVQFSEPSRPRRRPGAARALPPTARRAQHDRAVDGGEPASSAVGARSRAARGGRVGMALFPVDADGVWRRVAGPRPGRARARRARRAGGDPSPRRRARSTSPGRPARSATISFWRVRERPLRSGGRARPDRRRRRDRPGRCRTLHPTPVGGDLMPGAEIHANAIQTVLDGYPLRDAPAVRRRSCSCSSPACSHRSRRSSARPARALAQALGAGAARRARAARRRAARVRRGHDPAGRARRCWRSRSARSARSRSPTCSRSARAGGCARRSSASCRRTSPPSCCPSGDARAAAGEPPAGGDRAVLRPARLHDARRSGSSAEQVIAVLNRYLDGVSSARSSPTAARSSPTRATA